MIFGSKRNNRNVTVIAKKKRIFAEYEYRA
nr:MAG TPA: hypothetical protein [Caudoviricetes sp.]